MVIHTPLIDCAPATAVWGDAVNAGLLCSVTGSRRTSHVQAGPGSAYKGKGQIVKLTLTYRPSPPLYLGSNHLSKALAATAGLHNQVS